MPELPDITVYIERLQALVQGRQRCVQGAQVVGRGTVGRGLVGV